MRLMSDQLVEVWQGVQDRFEIKIIVKLVDGITMIDRTRDGGYSLNDGLRGCKARCDIIKARYGYYL